ncbi:hypothetical protein DICPUDRAFT_42819 [Dictyostelium purpureum]|uniref:t-SNARE coiled-coil homology domain-containing protein n=1 Tax=Dictyostelium purpureum TaxID=5786 RepID=F1A2U8_DICPU|nr:uncharacterized protein DICPUDRAFT_42819 [Dictyostelium purpureum]EGC29480.1 hypothetical protein DICPUDRAFT_42819 [Dictyostelium purpureum]|eukprot:XP_003293989.1 hypothetical protein DICPUDRAFT_42819 [Dictyostelium purpureum]
MGDYWINQHEDIVKLLNTLTADIKEFSLQQRNNPGVAPRNSPTALRNNLVYISTEIARLQDSLTYGNLRITEQELLRRKNKVENLVSIKNQLSNTLDSAINNTNSKNALLGGNNNNGRAFGQFGKPRETDQTRQFDNTALYNNQKEIMKQQDESLDLLSNSIMRTKNIAYAMNNELEAHNEILDDIEIGTERTTVRLKNTNSKMEVIKQNAGSTCMIVTIVILIIIIVILIATDSGCKIYNDPKHCP